MIRLKEWLDSSGQPIKSNNNSAPQASKNYKNRFKKLTNYAIAHKAPTATKAEIKQLNNNGFTYAEHHNDNGKEYDIALSVATSKFTDVWKINYFIDGTLKAVKAGSSYEDLLRALAFYMNTPNIGTPDYDDLLIESKSTVDDFEEYKNMWDNL